MKDKHLANGEPDVIFCRMCSIRTSARARRKVILPITDPYVVHHGALGSFATVYLMGRSRGGRRGLSPASPASMSCSSARQAARASNCRRTAWAISSSSPAAKTRHKVIGTSRDKHDLSGLTEPLRSHGGLTEQEIPIIVNRKTAGPRPGTCAISMPSRSAATISPAAPGTRGLARALAMNKIDTTRARSSASRCASAASPSMPTTSCRSTIPTPTKSSARCRRAAPSMRRKAFEIAASFKPKLTRYERQQILFRTAELIRAAQATSSPISSRSSSASRRRIRSMNAGAPTTSSRWRASSPSSTTARSFPAI